jgi:small subunit ribosomal protein S13
MEKTTATTVKTRYIVRIAATDLDGTKKVFIALQKIKGIGDAMSNAVCHMANIPREAILGQLTEEQIKKIDSVIDTPTGLPTWMMNHRKDFETGTDSHLTGADLVFSNDMGIKRLKMVKSYRGMRHAFGLPARGQSTRSNHRKNKQKKAMASRSRSVKKPTEKPN